MQINESSIKKIAELLICGDLCFLNVKTGKIESFPYKTEFNNDDDPWQETKDKIIAHFQDYVKYEPLDKDEYLEIIQMFVLSIKNTNRKIRFEKELLKPKPIFHFNELIDSYVDLKRDWTEFRLSKYKERIEKSIDVFKAKD